MSPMEKSSPGRTADVTKRSFFIIWKLPHFHTILTSNPMNFGILGVVNY